MKKRMHADLSLTAKFFSSLFCLSISSLTLVDSRRRPLAFADSSSQKNIFFKFEKSILTIYVKENVYFYEKTVYF